MREITPENAAAYLRDTGRVPAGAEVSVRPLGWGVSNIVLRVEVAGQAPFVLKQSRERLRVAQLWVSRLERIWTEVEALRLLGAILEEGTVPEVLFEDRENYLFAMTHAPEGARVWKECLLRNEVDWHVACDAGDLLGRMHAEAAGRPELSGRLSDTTVFDELRIDPFYRAIAREHRDLAARIDALIASLGAWDDRTFVHADFSPKNLLVSPEDHLTVVDFETAHAGDPAFDLGFFTSHLILKAFALNRSSLLAMTDLVWRLYLARAGQPEDSPRVGRALRHAAACTLARIDGKSPVDYLDEPRRGAARRFARAALRREPADWAGLADLAAREMQ